MNMLHSGNRNSVRYLDQVVLVFCAFSLLFNVAEAQLNDEAPEWTLELFETVQSITPGPEGEVVAVNATDGRVLLVDVTKKEVKEDLNFDGAILSTSLDHVQLPGGEQAVSQTMLTVIALDDRQPNNAWLHYVKIANDGFDDFTTFRPPARVFENLKTPAASLYNFQKAGPAFVIWDRYFDRVEDAFWFIDESGGRKGVLKYDILEFIPINNGRFILGLAPGQNVAVLIDASEDVPFLSDVIYVEGLNFSDSGSIDLYHTETQSGQDDLIFIVDNENNSMSMLRLDRSFSSSFYNPITVSLPFDDVLGGKGAFFVAADISSNNTIVVGTQGSDRLAVFELIGGQGLKRIGSKKLPSPVRDAVVQRDQLGRSYFIFLAQDGQSIAAVRDVFALPDLDDGATVLVPPTQNNQPLTAQAYQPGAEAIQLQSLLARLGFSVGAIDGIPGKQTKAGVRAFQLARGIAPTAALTDETLDALNLEMVRMSKASDYVSFLNERLPGFEAARMLTLGQANDVRESRCFKLNESPPEELWENSVNVARIVQDAESILGESLVIISAYRNKQYNRCIKGSSDSPHLRFSAAAVWHRTIPREVIAGALQRASGATRANISLIPNSGYVHLSTF